MLQSLRKITQVLLSSAASFLAIASLILLFMIVFAIIGLHVYGGTQQSGEYPNFGTFLLSVTTMFQVSRKSSAVLWLQLYTTFMSITCAKGQEPSAFCRLPHTHRMELHLHHGLDCDAHHLYAADPLDTIPAR